MKNRIKNTLETIRLSLLDRDTLKPLGIALTLFLIHSLISMDFFYQFFHREKYQILQSEINSIDQQLLDSSTISEILNLSLSTEASTFSKERPNCIYQKYDLENKEIEYWSQKSMILPFELVVNSESELKFVTLDQQPFLIKSKLIGSKAIVLILDLKEYVRKHYYPAFSFRDGESEPYQIIGYTDRKGFQFKDGRGRYLFSILKSGANDDWIIILNLLFILFEFFFFIKALNHFARRVSTVYPFIGCAIFFLILYNFRKIFAYFKIPAQFYSLKLFNPALYKSSVNSLGDLLILIITTQLIILFIRRNFKIDYQLLKKFNLEFVLHTLTITILLGEAFSMSKIFHGLVVESSIWFNFNYFPRLTAYSFIGLAIMLMTFTNYYLLSNFLVQVITKLRLKPIKIFISLGINLLLIVFALIFLKLRFEVYILFFVLIAVLSISYGIYYMRRYSRTFDIALFLFFASSVSTYLLYINNARKDDLILSSIASNIAFGKDKNLENRIQEYIAKKSQNHEWIDTILMNKIFLKKIDEYAFSKLIHSSKVERNLGDNLKLINENNERYYIAKFREDTSMGYWMILPSNYLNRISSYTKESINEIVVRDQNISYALYHQDSLIEQSGDYPYKKKFITSQFHPKRHNENSYSVENRVYRINENLKAIITTSEVRTLSLITQFSYVFCFNIILFIFFEIFAYYLKIGNSSDFVLKYSSLRSKILLTFFFLIVGIFAGVTYFSYVNLNNKFKEYNKEQLKKELKNIQLTIQSALASRVKLEDVSDYLFHTALLNNNSIQLYTDHGLPIYQSGSSQQKMTLSPDYYKRLLLDQEMIIHENKTRQGNLYHEAMGLISDQSSSAHYILTLSNSPHLGNRNEATKLIVALLNLYVILFFAAMIIAFWISNAVTKPLQLIASKLPFVQLSKKNEYLQYEYDDEIGDLVKKYNHMLDEIERSTRQLVYQEREVAWTEMAKQIAHEIKNPLTPMKLKIQYMQKKIKEGNADIEKLTLGVSETLIEQINNLDTIASSFSDFAKLHQPKIEELDWCHLIRNVCNVFENNQVKIDFHSSLDIAMIRCDQNQMISCVNNLIKNAIQSYETEEGITILVQLSMVRNQYLLRIQDFGKGISQENLARVFAPNFTTKSSGSGLGLPITKKIINSFDGTIELESKEGEGTCFYVFIPVLEQYYKNSKEYSARESQWIQEGMIDLSRLDVLIDLKYTSEENVFRKKLYRDFSIAFGHDMLFHKLSKAIDLLKKENPRYRFVLWDALRPHEIQQDMWDAYEGEDRSKYVAPPERASIHNYGMAVDLGIVSIHPNANLDYEFIDFGCAFDDFSELAHIDYMLLDEKAIDHRQMLKRIMEEAGFHGYENEWWHFEAGEKEWVKANLKRW